MHTIEQTIHLLESGAFDRVLAGMYACTGDALLPYRRRFLDAITAFRERFGDAQEIALFSAPGRTELGGNHTDHQGGHVLAASVDLDAIAVAAVSQSGMIRLCSAGMPEIAVDISDLSPRPEEVNTADALVRGIAAKFCELGCPVTGFDAYTTSDVLCGSGLSSSAAFEVLTANICNTFFAEERVDAAELAKIGLYAENVYFGKPCGLMDQMACSVGGVAAIDFKGGQPVLTRTALHPEREGYALCILDSGAHHADLTEDYAAIPAEMRAVARALGVSVLSETDIGTFMQQLPMLRSTCGDRAVLRALHFFEEDARAVRETQALQNGDFSSFLAEVRASGHSSFMYLQNICTYRDTKQQELAVVIALCEHLLQERGAVRVHGGGFAGTVQAFVPLDMLEDFRAETERILGTGCCHVLRIRSLGGVHMTVNADSFGFSGFQP